MSVERTSSSTHECATAQLIPCLGAYLRYPVIGFPDETDPRVPTRAKGCEECAAASTAWKRDLKITDDKALKRRQLYHLIPVSRLIRYLDYCF
jgi:hypothetical protein